MMRRLQTWRIGELNRFGQGYLQYAGPANQPPMEDNLPLVEVPPRPAHEVVIHNLEYTFIEDPKGVFCTICHVMMVYEEFVKEIPCKHQFREECIVTWLGQQNTCPVCRQAILAVDE